MAYLVAGWGAVGAAYALGCRSQGRAVLLPTVAIDRAIGFRPDALALYLSFFLFVPWTFMVARPRRLPWLALAMQACALVAGATFVIWPSTAGVPPPEAPALLLRFVALDTHANCLPSLHGALSALCAWALLDVERPLRTALAVVWAALICWSALALRRHLAIDLGAGIALGVLCGAALLPSRRWGW